MKSLSVPTSALSNISFKKLVVATSIALAATFSASQALSENTPIYEIAIQEIKPGMEAQWAEQRAELLQLLDQTEGTEKDWTFKSFFTFPQPGPQPVYLGITRWSSQAHFDKAAKAIMPTQLAQDFFSTVNLLSFVQVTPADGGDFVLEDIINKSGQVLEVAVREPKAGLENVFDAYRDGFFKRVSEQPGYLFDREFVTADGMKVVLIGWENMAHFQTALGALSQMPEMGTFFGAVDAKAYQATVLE